MACKDILSDEYIQTSMTNIEHEVAFYQECIVALQKILAGYECILDLRRKERERQVARAEMTEATERAGERD